MKNNKVDAELERVKTKYDMTQKFLYNNFDSLMNKFEDFLIGYCKNDLYDSDDFAYSFSLQLILSNIYQINVDSIEDLIDRIYYVFYHKNLLTLHQFGGFGYFYFNNKLWFFQSMDGQGHVSQLGLAKKVEEYKFDVITLNKEDLFSKIASQVFSFFLMPQST